VIRQEEKLGGGGGGLLVGLFLRAYLVVELVGGLDVVDAV
jgi:hypothetical protein